MEVICTGRWQNPEQIVSTVIQEDVDAIGFSSLSKAYLSLFMNVLDLLKERGVRDILVFGGGIIPKDHTEYLKK
jgi:methylmalonyl-CoA mutase, C-terminal domain